MTKLLKNNRYSPSLSLRELLRYDRQLKIPTFTEETQKRLKRSRVTILGIGGVGCPAALYLAVAGIGKIKLVDFNTINLSDLNRQILYNEENIGQRKVESARNFLRKINSDISVEVVNEKVSEENVKTIVNGSNFVVDGLDKARDRLMVNKACLEENIPASHAFIHGFRGDIISVFPGRGACLACSITPEIPVSLSGSGVVIGVTAGIIGILQAAECLKFLTSIGNTFFGQRIMVDLLDFIIYHIKLEKIKNCPHCDY